MRQATAPPTNRRTTPRRQATLGTICRLTATASAVERVGLVWNISASGVSMLMHEPLQAGTLVTGVLTTMDEKASLPVTMRVIHVKPIRTGDYFLGAQFQRPLEPAEMRPFLAEPDLAS